MLSGTFALLGIEDSGLAQPLANQCMRMYGVRLIRGTP
jgi:hypothetical protein